MQNIVMQLDIAIRRKGMTLITVDSSTVGSGLGSIIGKVDINSLSIIGVGFNSTFYRSLAISPWICFPLEAFPERYSLKANV